MKRPYIFLIMIFFVLYLSYLIVGYKYKEYKINNHIEYVKNENERISDKINENKESLEYLNTDAYKNKVLKEEQALKNKGETVVFITTENKYNIYTKKEQEQSIISVYQEKPIYDGMNIREKWVYFLFKKDIR